MHDPSFSQSRPFFGCLFWDLQFRRGNAPPGPFLILLSPAAVERMRSTARLVSRSPPNRPRAEGRRQWSLGPMAQPPATPAVSAAPILRGEHDDVGRQDVFIGPSARHFPLCRAMLPEHATGEPFRDPELLPDMLDASTAAGGAQKFPDAFGPWASPRRMSFSSVRSETAFRSRSFSFSSSFSRFTWSVFSPPNCLRHR